MSEEAIVKSIDGVSDAVDKSSNAGNLGIKGWILTNIVQATAATIVAGSMIYMGYMVIDEWKVQTSAMREQGKEDRSMFREAVKLINDSADRRYEKSEITHGRAMEKMGDRIEKMLISADAQTAAVKEATVEMKETSRELKNAVKVMEKAGRGPGG